MSKLPTVSVISIGKRHKPKFHHNFDFPFSLMIWLPSSPLFPSQSLRRTQWILRKDIVHWRRERLSLGNQLLRFQLWKAALLCSPWAYNGWISQRKPRSWMAQVSDKTRQTEVSCFFWQHIMLILFLYFVNLVSEMPKSTGTTFVAFPTEKVSVWTALIWDTIFQMARGIDTVSISSVSLEIRSTKSINIMF